LIYILNDPLALQLRLYLSMYINIRLWLQHAPLPQYLNDIST
jgi:hypothetical protein